VLFGTTKKLTSIHWKHYHKKKKGRGKGKDELNQKGGGLSRGKIRILPLYEQVEKRGVPLKEDTLSQKHSNVSVIDWLGQEGKKPSKKKAYKRLLPT